jgi:hypothetical protein
MGVLYLLPIKLLGRSCPAKKPGVILEEWEKSFVERSTSECLISSHLVPLGLQIAIESGTYVMASSGLLPTEINTLESRFQQLSLCVVCGHNVNVCATHSRATLCSVFSAEASIASDHCLKGLPKEWLI